MHILNLPHDCLVLIFKQQFTLQQLFQCRAVHREWKFVVDAYFLKSVKNLKIFSSCQQIPVYENQLRLFDLQRCEQLKLRSDQTDVLYIPSSHFTLELASFLVRIFASVETLALFLSNTFPHNEICSLITGWSKTLNTLMFAGWILTIPHDRIARQFYHSLTYLTPLKNLHILVFNLSLQDNSLVDRVFEQIEHFSGHLTVHDAPFPNLGSNCTELRLNQGPRMSETQISRRFSLNCSLRDSVRHLYLGDIKDEFIVPSICASFRELRSLEVHQSPYFAPFQIEPTYSFDLKLLHHLANLAHLTELRLPDISLHLGMFHIPDDLSTLDTVTLVHLTGRLLLNFTPAEFRVDTVVQLSENLARTMHRIFPRVRPLRTEIMVVDGGRFLQDGQRDRYFKYCVLSDASQ